MHGWISKSFCKVKEAKHQRVYALWLHLYEVQTQVKLIYGDRNEKLSSLGLERSDTPLSGVVFYCFHWDVENTSGCICQNVLNYTLKTCAFDSINYISI
jgi:hypothetical protein